MCRKLPADVVWVALVVVAFNLLDAFFTLLHIGHGALELNPLMRALLQQSATAFVAGKYFVVAAGIVVLAGLDGRRLSRSGTRLVILPAYAAVALYHLALFACR